MFTLLAAVFGAMCILAADGGLFALFALALATGALVVGACLDTCRFVWDRV